MPQMAPLSWLTLFLLFISIFILFNVWNFYNFDYTPAKTSTKSKTLKFNWKW